MKTLQQAAQGQFIYLPTEKVLFGSGCLAHLPNEIDRLDCRRAFIITGHTLATQTPMVKRVENMLGALHAGTYAGIRQHAPEDCIEEALNLIRERQVDLLISLGGGSPIDSAKVAAYRLAHDSDPKPGASSYLPHIAIPTTLSAAEFSHVAGYMDIANRAKRSISDHFVTPRLIFLDPQATLFTPMWLWLASGIRSLDHAIETIYSPGVHPISNVLALQAVQDLLDFLPQSRSRPENLEIRHSCQLAAWMSYFSPPSVNAHNGLSHRIGKRIGATYDVPHGITSCILLPHVMRYKASSEDGAVRLATVARALNLVEDGTPNTEAALKAADAVAKLVKELDLPFRLREVNVPREAFEDIAQATVGNTPQKSDVVEILERAW